MKTVGIEHIGIAVKNLEDAVNLYERLLGVPCSAVESVDDQQVRTAFFRIGDTRVELLQSTSADGPIARFIDKRGEGVHHIALAVGRLPDALREADDLGLQRVDTEGRPGSGGSRIAFIHPKSTHGVLLELCEKGRP